MTGTPRAARAARGEELPTGHPIYPLLSRLRTVTGSLTPPATRVPLTRGEVYEALWGEGSSRAEGEPPPQAPIDSLWAAGLRAEILRELTGDGGPAQGWARLNLRLGLRSRFEVDPGGRSRLRETLRGEFAADLTSILSIWESFEIDTHGDRDPDFLGRRWEDALTGRVDRAGIALRGRHGSLVWGRSAFRWGPGRVGSLILSPTPPPLDRLEIDLALGPAHLSAFAAPLGSEGHAASGAPPDSAANAGGEGTRHLSAHRLSLRFPPHWEAGLSEVVVYGGPGRGFEAYYLNPLIPFYAEQWNQEAEDNILWSADLTWTPAPGRRLWGEFLVDDFQFDFTTEPHQVGWTVGGESALPERWLPRTLAAFEATRIESYVYGHPIPWNRYLHEGVGLGHPIGPDVEALLATLTKDFGERTTAAFLFAGERHGARTAATPQEAVSPHGEDFPTSPTRRIVRAELSASWRPRVTRRLDAAVTYVDDELMGCGWSGRLAITLRLDRDLAFAGVSSGKGS